MPEQVTVTTGADSPVAGDQAPRRRGRPGNDLEAVLQAAVEVFNERGYDGASMEDLSKRLGIAKSGDLPPRVGQGRAAPDGPRPGPRRALGGRPSARGRWTRPRSSGWRRSSATRSRVLVTRLPYVTLLLRVRGNTDVEREALARRRAFDALVASLVEEAERDGDIRTDIDPKLTARLLFGTVNSLVEWYRPASRCRPRRWPTRCARSPSTACGCAGNARLRATRGGAPSSRGCGRGTRRSPGRRGSR